MPRVTIPPLYAITDAAAGLSHVEQVEQFVQGGARLVQVRDKSATGRKLYDVVIAALTITRNHSALLVVNDRVDVALAARADGVHVGQDDLSASDARSILGPDKIVGVSTHSVSQARAARALQVDYIAIGPVFATTTKLNPDPVVGLHGVAAVRRAIGSMPLVAIGGIKFDTASEVIAAGASSVAIVGDLFEGESCEHRVRRFVSLLDVTP